MSNILFIKEGEMNAIILCVIEIKELNAKNIADKMCSEIAIIKCPTLLSQFYDGASVMSSKKGGVQKYISDTFDRYIPYVHCLIINYI